MLSGLIANCNHKLSSRSSHINETEMDGWDVYK